MRHNCLRFPDKYISVRDVEDAVPYKLWKEHYEFVECGKVQVRRGRVTTPYRMGETKVNTKGNTAQFPPYGLSTAPTAAARHLRCQNAR